MTDAIVMIKNIIFEIISDPYIMSLSVVGIIYFNYTKISQFLKKFNDIRSNKIPINNIEEVEEEAEEKTVKNVSVGLDEMMDNSQEDFQSEIDKTDNFLAGRIDTAYAEEGYFDNIKSADKKLLRQVMSELDNRGSRLKNYVKRIDDKGRIILPLDAIDFLTNKHEPIVMIDGTIRAINILEIEEELLFALLDKKPVFYFNKRMEAVERIPEEIIKMIEGFSQDVDFAKEIIRKEEEAEELQKQLQEKEELNIELFSRVDEIKESHQKTLKKQELLFASIEMLTEKHKNSDNVFSAVEKEEVVKTKEVMVETSNKIKKDIIEVKELEKKVRSSFVRPTSIPKAIRDASKKATTDKEEIGEAEQKKEPIENVIVEPEVLIVESVEKVEEIPLENSIIVAQEIVPIVKSEDNVIEPETVPVKKITKQDKKKIISTLLTQEYLFSARNFNVAPHPQEISFLCKVVENDKNYLYFRKGGINKSLTDVLKDLYGQHDKKAKEVFLLLDFVVERVFIADLTNPSLFKTDVIKIEVDEKLLFGTSIQDRYLCPVTQELLIREAKISEGKRAVYFNDLVDLFTRGKHEAI